MSNGSEACCALGICCPPASAERKAAVAKILRDNTEAGKFTPETAAECMIEHFALAPKSFETVIADIVGRAKKHFTASA